MLYEIYDCLADQTIETVSDELEALDIFNARGGSKNCIVIIERKQVNPAFVRDEKTPEQILMF